MNSDRVEGSRTNRRHFLQLAGAIGIGGQALLRSGSVKAALLEARGTERWPTMEYRTLGRTGFEGSRLVFGCGAALSNGQAVRLLEPAFEAGINVFDVGYRRYYRDAEKNLAPFVRKHGDDILLISKANTGLETGPNDPVTSAEARESANTWMLMLEESLTELQVSHIDAYYVMAAYNPYLLRSEEMGNALMQAKQSGKISWTGISTHQNAQAVLEAAIDTGWYDLAQIAITPAGWYDWQKRAVLAGTPPMAQIRPLLDRARSSGIGLIGMKAGRSLAGRRWLGQGNEGAFNGFYPETLVQAKLSAFQRSYAYVLGNGLDAVNADMQSYPHLFENFVAAATSTRYFPDGGEATA